MDDWWSVSRGKRSDITYELDAYRNPVRGTGCSVYVASVVDLTSKHEYLLERHTFCRVVDNRSQE